MENNNNTENLNANLNFEMKPPNYTPPPLSPPENFKKDMSENDLEWFKNKEKEFNNKLKKKLENVYVEQETKKEIDKTVKRWINQKRPEARSPYVYYGMKLF